VRDSSGADVTAFFDATSVSSGRKPVPDADDDDGRVHNLFAFPAEDNFAGACLLVLGAFVVQGMVVGWQGVCACE